MFKKSRRSIEELEAIIRRERDINVTLCKEKRYLERQLSEVKSQLEEERIDKESIKEKNVHLREKYERLKQAFSQLKEANSEDPYAEFNKRMDALQDYEDAYVKHLESLIEDSRAQEAHKLFNIEEDAEMIDEVKEDVESASAGFVDAEMIDEALVEEDVESAGVVVANISAVSTESNQEEYNTSPLDMLMNLDNEKRDETFFRIVGFVINVIDSKPNQHLQVQNLLSVSKGFNKALGVLKKLISETYTSSCTPNYIQPSPIKPKFMDMIGFEVKNCHTHMGMKYLVSKQNSGIKHCYHDR